LSAADLPALRAEEDRLQAELDRLAVKLDQSRANVARAAERVDHLRAKAAESQAAADEARARALSARERLERSREIAAAYQDAMRAGMQGNPELVYRALSAALSGVEEMQQSADPLRPDRAAKLIDGLLLLTAGIAADPDRLAERALALRLHLIGKAKA